MIFSSLNLGLDIDEIMSSKLKWLIVIHLLLSDQTLCRAPSPPGLLPGAAKMDQDQLQLGSNPRPSAPSAQNQDRIWAAKQVIHNLSKKLDMRVQANLPNLGEVSCEDLLSASDLDDPSSSLFPQELVGFSLVPVLVMAGCSQEAQTVVLRLYDLLGEKDAEELLMDLEDIIEKKLSLSGPTRAASPAASRSGRYDDGHRMEAVMFNIQQLAVVGKNRDTADRPCEGWIRVNGTSLVGRPAAAATSDLDEALKSCGSFGVLCAGVTSSEPLKYQAVLKKGSSILPSEYTESECWIHQCGPGEDPPNPVPTGRRGRRSAGRCINKSEERVYHVMEWIPAVSTLYNLGTAVYYASVNCSQTAKHRAILSAVDLGTDAIMVATGGTAGVAGFALGAGVKTGVKAGIKYLFKSMREEDDVLVNQLRWEDGVFTTD